MIKKAVFLLLLILLSSAVYAANEVVQSADRLNYWSSETHTVTVTNNGADSVLVNISIPTGFSYSSGTCTNPSASLIQCDLATSTSKNYVVTSAGTLGEYTISSFAPVTNNSYTGNTVKFIKIKDNELVHTLVEYGRGRGNYFFDSYGAGYAGSGHTEAGCAYVPNGTMFELNYLHKINNIKQYYGDLTAEVYNATFDCVYPNSSVVRVHLSTAIVTNNTGAFVSYRIPKIEGSWERMGYLGMDFKANEAVLGNYITINCTDIIYSFPAGGGYFKVNEDSFKLQVRNKEPFTASASTTATIGNGTQEVLITYNITNNELYTVNNVIIEIFAPPYATFIGTRGELWGTALDQYRVEKAQLLPGESEIIRLVARFDTTNAPSMSAVNLTKSVKINYVACWELNAYNPGDYTQMLTSIGTGTVNMGVPSTIVGVTNQINLILETTKVINTTIININNTVNNIQTIVQVINTTTKETNFIVKQINNTANTILNQTQIVLNNTNIILNDTSFIFDQLNCNGTNDSPICDKIRTINNSVYNLYNLTWLINYTASNLNITVIENINTSGVNITVNVDLTNLTNKLREVKSLINCTAGYSADSVCGRVERIENLTWIVNNSVNYLQNMTSYFNTTVFGNYTFQQILNSLTNVSIDTSEVLIALQELRAFDEEIVFLITDSFNFQQIAKDEFASGDLGSAVNNLIKANDNLRLAAEKLSAEKDNLSATELSPEGFSTTWVWVGAIFVIIAGVIMFYFSRRTGKGGKMSTGPLKLLLLVIFLLMCVNFVSATWGPLGTIVQVAEDLNFGDAPKNMTVQIYYNCTGTRMLNMSLPSGFTLYFTGAPCGLINSTLASCNFNPLSPFNQGSYTFGGSNLTNYNIFTFPAVLSNYTNCTVTNNVSIIKVPSDEVFYTLVEYGRGRGNYFYSTKSGTAGSGHTGVGCNYVPNGTLFELNFLHKIFNIKQYYDDATMIAENATFSCTYPNRTIVRTHMGTGISQNASGTTITYLIDQIEGSWERMGYVGMQFDSTEQQVGQNLTITCNNIKYYLPRQQGFVTVYKTGTSFNLQVRNPQPFVASATTTTATVGNGTQEVIITYNITNNEVYSVDDVVIEIEAPPYATFIGTRGELWGTALGQYRIEKISFGPGESEIVQLVARFDTTNAPFASSIDLTRGIKVSYVTCWELNAYNPAESMQRIYGIGSTGLNMSVSTSVIDIRERLQEIYNLVTFINNTATSVNNTVTTIQSIVTEINSTTIETNTIVKEINNTVNTIYTDVNTILTNTQNIITDTTNIKNLIDCNGTGDTPMCSWLDSINSSINNITSILISVNNTLNNITINVTIDLSGENISVNVTPDLTNITIIVKDIADELNCSMNWTTEPNASICQRLLRIENNTLTINSTVEQINNLVNYFNSTVFGNITLKQIYDAISNTTVDTSELLLEINRMRAFDEELVFLVTDAFGLQEAAKSDVNNGDLGSAAAKLKDANSKLNQAAERLMTIEKEQEATLVTAESGTNFGWVLAAMALIIVAALAVYLYSKPKK